jgi:hypothetical protein
MHPKKKPHMQKRKPEHDAIRARYQASNRQQGSRIMRPMFTPIAWPYKTFGEVA